MVASVVSAQDRSSERSVRDALAHLHDLPYLQRHPLAVLVRDAPGVRPSRVSRALQERLTAAIEALAPGGRRGSDRAYRLMQLRYVEALEIAEVCRQLGVGKTEYHRAHGEGVAAVAAQLADLGAAPAGDEPPPPGVIGPPPTTFIGRERDLARLAELLRRGRLVTLTGPPGTGKTRLAREALAALDEERFPDGGLFVELAPVAEPALVVPTIGRAIGLRTPAGDAGLAQVAGHLRGKRLLLVLDNCEQVADAAPEIGRLVAACPDLVVLATSRVPLRVYGERELPLAPLDEAAAAELFVDRARAVRPELVGDGAVVVALCRRLDCLPLALELAAARVGFLPPEAMLGRLDAALGALDLGRGGARDLPERQRTLRGAIAWSHDLLSADERRVFRWLGVFVGGFDLAATPAVGGDGAEAGLEALVGHSLVQQTASVGEPRFTMLETIRAFALEQLALAGEADDAAAAHAVWALGLAEAVGERTFGSAAQIAALDRLGPELDNLRAALRWHEARGDDTARLRLALAAAPFWVFRGDRDEGRRWVRGAPAEVLLRAGPKAIAALTAMWAWLAREDADAVERAARHAAETARERGDARGELDALGVLWAARGWPSGLGGDAVDALWKRRLELARALDDRFEAALSQWHLGMLAHAAGDSEAAARLLGDGRDLFRAADNPWGVASAGVALAGVALADGRLDGAAGLYEEALALYRRIGDRTGEANATSGLAEVARRQRELTDARELTAEALTVMREVHSGGPWAWRALDRAALLAADLTRPALALRLAAAAGAGFERLDAPRPPDATRLLPAALAAARAALTEEAADKAEAIGRAMSVDEAIEQALDELAQSHEWAAATP